MVHGAINPAVLKHEQLALNWVFTEVGGDRINEGSAVNYYTHRTPWNYKTPARPFYQDFSRPVHDPIGLSFGQVFTDRAGPMKPHKYSSDESNRPERTSKQSDMDEYQSKVGNS